MDSFVIGGPSWGANRLVLDVKPTSQALSAPGDIDHLKFTGGKGISQQLYGMPIG